MQGRIQIDRETSMMITKGTVLMEKGNVEEKERESGWEAMIVENLKVRMP